MSDFSSLVNRAMVFSISTGPRGMDAAYCPMTRLSSSMSPSGVMAAFLLRER